MTAATGAQDHPSSLVPAGEPRSRYPGTRPFSDSPDDVARFFGRNAEAEELYLRVRSVPLLVQFGKSGLGKTSLLQAGLFPRLRQKPFLPVMIRLNNPEESLTGAVARAIAESCASEGIEPTYRSAEGLWELLSSLTVWRDDLLLTPVLVFDQFEEVFTLRDAAFRAEIASELGALASGIPPSRVQGGRRPDVKVVISLREDYLGALEEFSAAIPSLFQERLRLGPMTREAARDAITGPAQLETAPGEPQYFSPRFDFDPSALEMLIADLEGKSGVIEPFQLQLLARHAEIIATRKGAGLPARLAAEDFRGTHDFESVLKNFYRETLRRIGSHSQRARAQRLIEEGLLGAAGHRLMPEERQILSNYGVTLETLGALEASRLLRRERRLESVFYEISHDRLADSIFRGRKAKLPRKVQQALWLAAVLALVIMTGLAIAHRRVSRERDAAERWLTVLLGEQFFGELRDSGRSTLSKRLQQEIAAQSRAGVGSPLTRGLTLRNHGDGQRVEGTLPQALTAFRAALAEFESLPPDVQATREIARTHDRIAETLVQQGQLTAALRHHDAAIAAWRRVVPQQSNDDCMALAESLTSAAKLNVRMSRFDTALRHCDAASDLAYDAMFDEPDRCGKRSGTVQPDPDLRAASLLASIALVHNEIAWDPAIIEGAATLASRAKELQPPSIKASTLALTALAVRGLARNTETSAAALDDYLSILKELRAVQRWDADNHAWHHARAVVQVLIANTMLGCVGHDPQCTLDEAETMAIDAKATLRTLAAADPSDLSLHDDLLLALTAHGRVLARRGKDFEAAAMLRFEEAERHHAGRRRDPADSLAAGYLARLLIEKAAAQSDAGDTAGAIATLRRIDGKLDPILAAHPEWTLVATALYRVRSMEAQMHEWTGDAAGAAAAASRAKALLPRFARYTEAAEALDQTLEKAIALQRAGDQLVARDPAAALRELRAAESALSTYLRRRPSSALAYFQLTETHRAMGRAWGKLRRNEEQLLALAAATTAAQLCEWLGPERIASVTKEQVFATHHELSAALVAQNRDMEALDLLQDVVMLGRERLAPPHHDRAALAIVGEAQCRMAKIQRERRQAGWIDTLRGGLAYLRRAAELDPSHRQTLERWTAYASEGAAATADARPSGSTRP